jgi:hypothetical protein
MFRRVSLWGLSCLLIVVVGCGGKKTIQSTSPGDIPDWYSNAPSDQNYVYAANTQASQDMQVAIDKATTGARSEIGRQMEVKLQGMQKKFSEETGTGDDAQLLQQFTQAEKTIVSTTLSGAKVKKSEIKKDGKMYRAYVLVEYPIGAANAALIAQVKKNEQMYTRYRASESFKELEADAEKYEQSK